MPQPVFLSLREDVSLSTEGPGDLVIRANFGGLLFREITPGTRAGLEQLNTVGGVEEQLIDLVLNADGALAVAQFCHCLRVLARRGLVVRTIRLNDEPVASVVPSSAHFTWDSEALPAEKSYVLSRFAYVRRDRHQAVLESPLCHCRMILHHWLASAVVQALTTPRTAGEVSASVAGLTVEAAETLMTLFLRAGFLDVAEAAASADERPALRSWEFHDLLFHARSRGGRHDGPTGATYRFAGEIDPPAAVKIEDELEWIDLRPVELGHVEPPASTLEAVQARRRSARGYGVQRITIDQLSEFLYRVARVRTCYEADVETGAGPVRMSFAVRPYPSAGAVYELEIYVAVHACDRLAPGLYHYDPQHHRLGRIVGTQTYVEELLVQAGRAATVPRDRLQTVIVLAARFPRIAWKYESIAYALILKNVGVLLQTMYLVATAMNLAPCAIGSGDADVFALAAGTDYYAETSVGEFLLGGEVGTE